MTSDHEPHEYCCAEHCLPPLSTPEADARKEPLKAVSNVIELDPTKKYLFVFKGDFTRDNLAYIQHRLKEQGITCLALGLSKGQEVEVIEQ